MNSFKYIKYLIITLISLSTISVEVYAQSDFECLEYEDSLSPEGNEIVFEAWAFINGVNQFDPRYEFQNGETIISFSYPYPDFIELEVFDNVLDTFCFYVIEIVDPGCENLTVRDWSTALSSSPNILSINQILFPICEANSGRFKLPGTENLVSSFDVNLLGEGIHDITVITFEGAVLQFTLTISDLDECSLDQIGCNALTFPVSALGLSLTPDLFLESSCDDLYEIRTPGGIWRNFLNLASLNPEVIEIEIRHPLTETICLSTVEIIDCNDYSTVCRDTVDIFLGQSITPDSIQRQIFEYFEEQCDNSAYQFILREDTVSNPTYYLTEIGQTIPVSVILQDESPICEIIVRLRNTEDLGCSIVQFDNSLILDPTTTNSITALDILIDPCPDENYRIALQDVVFRDSVSLDWTTLPNPFQVVVTTDFSAQPTGTSIYWDNQCYLDPICSDTFIIATENEAILIPTEDLVSSTICDEPPLVAHFNCMTADTIDLSNEPGGIYEVSMMVTPTAFCVANINLYRDCGFTCPDTVEIVISNGQLLSYAPIDLIDDECYNDNIGLGINIYSFVNNGQSTGNLNYTIGDAGTIDDIIVKNEITNDSCMIAVVIVDDQSACTDFECSKVSNLYLAESSDTFVLYPEDALVESCPNRNYKIQEPGGPLMDSLIMDINISTTYIVSIIDTVINQSCQKTYTLHPSICVESFICVDTVFINVDNQNPIVDIYASDALQDTCSDINYIFEDGIESFLDFYSVDYNSDSILNLSINLPDSDISCEFIVQIENTFDCSQISCLDSVDLIVLTDSLLVTAESLLLLPCDDRAYFMMDDMGNTIDDFWVDDDTEDMVITVVDSISDNECDVIITINELYNCDLFCNDLDLIRPASEFEPAQFTLSDVLDEVCLGLYELSGPVLPGPIIDGERTYFVNPTLETPVDITVSNLTTNQGCVFVLNFIDYNSFIEGHVYIDNNSDCDWDPVTEMNTLTNIVVEATNTVTSDVFYTTTGINGDYRFNIPAGDYNIRSISPNTNRWDECPALNFVLTDSMTIDDAHLVLQPVEDCYYPEVNVSGSFLRRCFTRIANVQYANMGSATMPDASVTISLDNFLTMSAASIPFTDLGDGMYQFDLGDLAPGAAGQIFIEIDTECSDDVILGQSLCITAEMTPISSCNIIDEYIGPDIDIIGECTPDSVKFLISNKGGDMLIPYEFIVIEDEILRTQQNIILNSGGTETISIEANGSTFSLVTNQVAENPFSRQISAFVEVCTDDGSDVSIGYANMFPLTDEEPQLDIECLEVRGSFDPNDKNGLPSGFTETRNIDIGIPIDYTIRFENIGNDTAFTVRVEDEIAKELDLSTLQLLGSSHEVNLTSQDRKLIFTFPNANLTPPMQDSMLAQGYVKFQIAPQKDLDLGTAIKNQAAIFFDFNSPIITNETLHTLGLNFPTSTNEVQINSSKMLISPNPAQNLIHLNIGEDIKGEVLAIDLYGRQHPLAQKDTVYDISGLTPGFYIIRINQNEISFVGKLIVH